MAYHGDFWLLIGTAAPVLALANVVAYAPSRRLARELRHERGGFDTWMARWSPLFLSVFGIFGCVDTLALALTATHEESDGSGGLFGGAGTAATALVCSLLALAMQAVTVGMAERRLDEIKRRRPKPGPRRSSES